MSSAHVVHSVQIEKGAGLPSDGVMVCGDSGNDIELFAVPNVRGCMVSNAHPELRKYCEDHASPSIFQVMHWLCHQRCQHDAQNKHELCT